MRIVRGQSLLALKFSQNLRADTQPRVAWILYGTSTSRDLGAAVDRFIADKKDYFKIYIFVPLICGRKNPIQIATKFYPLESNSASVLVVGRVRFRRLRLRRRRHTLLSN